MKSKVIPLTPGEVGRVLVSSLEADLLPWNPEPTAENMAILAQWGKACGLEVRARRSYAGAAKLAGQQGQTIAASEWARVAAKPELTKNDMTHWMAHRIAPWPDRWEAMVQAVKTFEARILTRDVERMNDCGNPWGRVVRLFWKGAKGREIVKSYGLHRCKSRFCPQCGRVKTRQRSEEIEKTLEIASEWGLGAENVRFLTVTVRNGRSIPELREQAHKAWAKLQRRRWWNRWVALWFRGSECITGEDGNWNFHLHVVLVLWGHRISYSRLWNEWADAVGQRSQIDVDRLHSQKMRKIRRAKGIGAAAAYITKYLAKGDELAKIQRGPGGFAHYASAMKRLRAFACGGAAPVLRAMAGVLLPNWAKRMEWHLEGVELRNGIAPERAEEVDTLTGEAIDVPIPDPMLDERERAIAAALTGPLLHWDEREGGGSPTVGRPCGKGKRWRRLGSGPVFSSVLKVKDFEAGKPMDALHSIIAGGTWKLFDEVDVLKSGKVLRYRIVLPGRRFAWRDAAAELWRRMIDDPGEWAQRRRRAFQAAAEQGLGTIQRLDMARAFAAAAKANEDALAYQLALARRELNRWRCTPHPDREGQVRAWEARCEGLERGAAMMNPPANVNKSNTWENHWNPF